MTTTRRRHPASIRGPRGVWLDLRELITAKSIPEPNSGCWLWLGGVRKTNGYGICKPLLAVGHGSCAHRVAHIAFKGPIPDGLDVLHSCDQPSCVNPDHLSLGTRLVNMADMADKKRGRGKIKHHDLPRGVKRHGRRFIARRSFAGRDRHFGMHDTPEAAEAAGERGLNNLRAAAGLPTKQEDEELCAAS